MDVPGTRAWCLRYVKLHANLTVYGAVCFLLAGRNLFEAVVAGAVTAPLFLLVGQVFWKAGIATWAVRERRRGADRGSTVETATGEPEMDELPGKRSWDSKKNSAGPKA